MKNEEGRWRTAIWRWKRGQTHAGMDRKQRQTRNHTRTHASPSSIRMCCVYNVSSYLLSFLSACVCLVVCGVPRTVLVPVPRWRVPRWCQYRNQLRRSKHTMRNTEQQHKKTTQKEEKRERKNKGYEKGRGILFCARQRR